MIGRILCWFGRHKPAAEVVATCDSHGFCAGDGPIRLSTTSGFLADYYVVSVEQNTISLRTCARCGRR